MANKYLVGNLPLDPRSTRVIQDLADQINQLRDEVETLRNRENTEFPLKANRESPVAGILTIPSDGSNGFLRISKDGVIISYVNPLDSVYPYWDGIAKGNLNAALTSLQSYTLPAGTLANDGDSLRIKYAGTFAANANNKRIQVSLGGFVISNLNTPQNSGGWDYDLLYTRYNPTTIFTSGQFMWHFGVAALGFLNTAYSTTVSIATVADLNINDIVLLVEAQGAVTNDVGQNLSYIELMKVKTIKR